jgi:DNA-directed RNA polymerase subunit K/omega
MDESLTPPEEAPAADAEPAPPIHSRFLFVDVSAQRAKQLRRGARARLTPAETAIVARPDMPHKLERVAMEEVRRGLIPYELPDMSLRGQEKP